MHYHEASHQWPLIQYWSEAQVACIPYSARDLTSSLINITTHLTTEKNLMQLKF